MSEDAELLKERDLAAEVARLERELAEARAALAAKPIVDRAQLFALTDSLPLLVSVIGCDHRYEFANKAYESWFGPEAGRVTGQHARDVLGEAAYERLLPHFDRAIAGERVTFEADIPYRTGGPRHVHATFAPRRAPDGEITGVIAMVIDLSRRFVDETALRESEDHYRHTVELNPQTSWTSAPDGQLDHVSRRWFEWTGTSGLGDTWAQGLHEDDRQRTFDVWGRSVASGEPYDIEHRVKMRDGSYRWMHSRAYPRRDDAGHVVKWYGTTEDIHDRKLAEQSLAAEVAERDAILSQLAEGVVIADGDGRIIFVNDAAARIHGMSRLHVGAADYAQTYGLFTEAGEPYPSLELPLARAVRGETVIDARWLIRRPDAEVLAVGSAKPVIGSHGKQIGAVLTLRDESAREMAEAAVRESEERFRELADNMSQFAWTANADGWIYWYNKRWYDFTGTSLEEMQGWGWRAVHHPDHVERVVDKFGAAIAAGELWEDVFPLRGKDGTYRWYLSRARPIRDDSGRIVRWFGTNTDITDQRAAEDALREETRSLETLNRVGAALAGELDLERLIQMVTDAGVELTGAKFGAYFHNVMDESGERLSLYTLSGAERAAFEKFGRSRATAIFGPTFRNEGVIRSDDILADPRYGKNAPHRGMPEGHLPVRSYLAVSVVSRSGEVLGGLLFGHPEPGRFTERHERLMLGVAAQAAIAIDNARLYQSAQREVDERRLAEAAVRESEARFRLIADSAPVPMWVTRLDRKREFVNRAYVDFLGISYEEAVDFDWRHVIHPDDVERIYKEQVAKEASLEPFTLEARYRDAKGDWRWLRSQSQPRWGANGEHAGFIGVAYDVTIAKEAELALTAEVAERTAERDRMWRLSQDILLIVTPDGVVRAINPAVERYGYTPDALVGEYFAPFVHPDDLAVTADAIERAKTEPVAGFETRLRAADGSWNWFSWSATPGEGVIFAFGRDVTAERVRQAELEAAQEALRQSQKMEAVGQLTGGVAHDFNNLLTPIMGSLDMLRRRLPPDDGRAQRTVDTALQATERAATLVQRLLAFARRQDLQARAVDVAELLGGMDDLLARSLGGGIRVTVDAPAELPAARVDPNQLELAILNLSINARDAMPSGGTLTITAREVSVAGREADLKPGRYVRIAVADTGIGMDAETVRRAVEPFFSTKGVGKGTGLGLSMAYGFAAQLGGALRLSSALGVGTTAELWLPVSDQPVAASAGARRPPQPALRTSNILLVDDEDLVRMGAADMLTDLGYNVVEARSAEEALSLLNGREVDFDLLISDYLMPDMNGAELAEAARRERPALPVLLVTGYTNLAEDAGADLPRLTKPFRQDDLAARVASMLKDQTAG